MSSNRETILEIRCQQTPDLRITITSSCVYELLSSSRRQINSSEPLEIHILGVPDIP